MSHDYQRPLADALCEHLNDTAISVLNPSNPNIFAAGVDRNSGDCGVINISGLQAQIDALAAAEKFVQSGVIVNPNTPSAALVLTLNDGSTVTINVGSLEDTFTAAQIAAVFGAGANITLGTAPTAISFLGSDGLTHTLNIPAIPATTHTLTNAAPNTLTSVVNGVSASAPIVNTVVLSFNGTGQLIVTVNGVASAPISLPVPATTHTMASAVNTMTSTVNGVAASAPIINANALTANAAGQLVSTVNGVASAPLTILASTGPLADGVADTQRVGAVGAAVLAARADHIHPIAKLANVALPAFAIAGNGFAITSTGVNRTVTDEERQTYHVQVTIGGNTAAAAWTTLTAPALPGYTLVGFRCVGLYDASQVNTAPYFGTHPFFVWAGSTMYIRPRATGLNLVANIELEYILN